MGQFPAVAPGQVLLMQAGGDAFRWYGSTDMDLRAPLKRTKHPLSLSTMLKPGGHWRRSVGTRYAHSIES